MLYELTFVREVKVNCALINLLGKYIALVSNNRLA